jgi:hypothetical protein
MDHVHLHVGRQGVQVGARQRTVEAIQQGVGAPLGRRFRDPRRESPADPHQEDTVPLLW